MNNSWDWHALAQTRVELANNCKAAIWRLCDACEKASGHGMLTKTTAETILLAVKRIQNTNTFSSDEIDEMCSDMSKWLKPLEDMIFDTCIAIIYTLIETNTRTMWDTYAKEYDLLRGVYIMFGYKNSNALIETKDLANANRICKVRDSLGYIVDYPVEENYKSALDTTIVARMKDIYMCDLLKVYRSDGSTDVFKGYEALDAYYLLQSEGLLL